MYKNMLVHNVLVLFLANICFTIINAKDLKYDITTSAAPTSTLQRSIPEGFKTQSDSLAKRDVKGTDSTSAKSLGVATKNYDPPPEFYRGPGSTGHFTSNEASSYYNNHKPYSDLKPKPIAFPDTYNSNSNNYYNKYNGAGGGPQGNGHTSWQHLKEKVGGLLNKNDGLQDRITVGHYGTAHHGSSSTSAGYAYEGRPYIPTSHHYGGSVAPSAHTSGYYGGSATAESIPFDVYGGKNHYSGSADNDYASYSYSDAHEPVAHKSHADISHKALLAKSFLIPLASAAVLGIAAALVSNPLLLQLGTVSGVAPGAVAYGKRKRRDLTTSTTLTGGNSTTNGLNLPLASIDENKNDLKLFPYRAHHQQQKQQRQRHVVRT